MLKCVATERAEESNKYSNQDNATAFHDLVIKLETNKQEGHLITMILKAC